MTDNSGRLKKRRKSTNLCKKTAAVAAMTHAFAALRQTGELVADQRVGGPIQAVPKPQRRRRGDGLPLAFGALGGAKFHTQARVRTPDHMAGLYELVVADHENKIVRNADLAAQAPAGDMLRTRQSMPPAPLKLIVPALSVRPRCNLRLSCIAASVAGAAFPEALHALTAR